MDVAKYKVFKQKLEKEGTNLFLTRSKRCESDVLWKAIYGRELHACDYDRRRE